MRRDCSADLFGFEAVEGRRVEGAFDGGTMTSDAGALLLGRADLSLLKTQKSLASVAFRAPQSFLFTAS